MITMDHYCEVNIAPMATSPDDPRYVPCGKIAKFKFEGIVKFNALTDNLENVWMCAERYDQIMAASPASYEGDDL